MRGTGLLRDAAEPASGIGSPFRTGARVALTRMRLNMARIPRPPNEAPREPPPGTKPPPPPPPPPREPPPAPQARDPGADAINGLGVHIHIRVGGRYKSQARTPTADGRRAAPLRAPRPRPLRAQDRALPG